MLVRSSLWIVIFYIVLQFFWNCSIIYGEEMLTLTIIMVYLFSLKFFQYFALYIMSSWVIDKCILMKLPFNSLYDLNKLPPDFFWLMSVIFSPFLSLKLHFSLYLKTMSLDNILHFFSPQCDKSCFLIEVFTLFLFHLIINIILFFTFLRLFLMLWLYPLFTY